MKQTQDAQAFSGGKGTEPLFQELYNVNGALGDDDATYALFQNLWQSNPALAGDCYPVIEPLLVRRGDYQLCLELIGNPETQFQIYSDSFEKQFGLAKHSAESIEQSRQKTEEDMKRMGRPVMETPFFNPGKYMLDQVKNGYVFHVCRLVEILVGTAHEEEAEHIRDQAVAVLDDPRLQSAVTRAQEHLKNPKAVPSAGESEAKPSPLFLSGLERAPDFSDTSPPVVPGPARIDPGSGLPVSSGRAMLGINPFDGLPVYSQPAAANDPFGREFDSFVAGERKSLDQRHGWPCSEMEEIYLRGQFNETLRRLQSLQITNAMARREMFGLWIEVAKKFPPARQALISVRDRDVGEFSGAGGSPEVFQEVKQINDYLLQTNQTYALFKSIYNRDAASAAPCYQIEEDDLMRRGEYAFCLQFYNPPEYLNRLHAILDGSKKENARWNENQKRRQAAIQKELDEQNQATRQFEQKLQAQSAQFRQDLWRKEVTNFDANAWDVPTSSPPVMTVQPAASLQPPPALKPPPLRDLSMIATNYFVRRVEVLVQIMVGAGHRVDAEKIRDRALAICDDPRIQSAVSDADRRIAQHSVP